MRHYIFFFLMVSLVSCGTPKSDLPHPKISADSIIPRDEMIHILVDVHLIEATLDLQKTRHGNIPLLTYEYYQWLFRKYHTSDQRFRKNLEYYKSDPENFSKMYEEVLKNLTDKARKPVVTGKK